MEVAQAKSREVSSVLSRLVTVIILLPLAIILIAFSVANRAPVSVSLDPINPDAPFLAMTLPLFVWLFIALFIGLLIGWTVTWFNQHSYRSKARRKEREVEELKLRNSRADRNAADPNRPVQSGSGTALALR